MFLTNNLERRRSFFPYVLCFPLFIYLGVVLFIPLVWGVSMAFTDKTIGGDASFVGLRNFIFLLGDKNFYKSLNNTALYTACSITGKVIFGMIMALSLNMEFKGRNLVRALLIIPWTLPNIVSALNWRWIFSDTGGVLNYLLGISSVIEEDLIWLGDPFLSRVAIIIVNIWRGTPFFGIAILARLQTIPKEHYEASEIDGASLIERFFHITLPSVTDVILLTALVSTIWTINEFDTVWLLTGGGPSGATEIINIYSYKTAMVGLQLGRSVAISVLLLPVFIFLIGRIVKYMLKDESH